MEYELYITKKNNWFNDDPQLNIPLEEWQDYVKNDPDMRLDNFTETKLPKGEVYRYDNPGAAVYLINRPGQQSEILAQFDFRSGNVSVKNPSQAVIEKMKHIAFKLGGRVQNEEGELYEEPEAAVETPSIQPADFLPQAVSNTFFKRWWKRWQSVFASAEEGR